MNDSSTEAAPALVQTLNYAPILADRGDAYDAHFRAFLTWADGRDVMDYATVAEYFLALEGAGYKANTVRIKRQAVKHRIRLVARTRSVEDRQLMAVTAQVTIPLIVCQNENDVRAGHAFSSGRHSSVQVPTPVSPDRRKHSHHPRRRTRSARQARLPPESRCRCENRSGRDRGRPNVG